MDDSELEKDFISDTPYDTHNDTQNNTIIIEEGSVYLFNMVAISILALCIVNGLCKGISRVHQYINESRQTNNLNNLSNYLLTHQGQEIEGIEGVEEVNGEITCSICIEAFTSSQTHIILECNHKFHTDCIKQWLEKELNCPLCRQSLQLN